MTALQRIGIAVFGAALLAAADARGQPLFASTESIEAFVYNAATVVVGTLVAEAEGGGAAEDKGRITASLNVAETLKGEHQETLRLRLVQPPAIVAGWIERSATLLVAVPASPDESARPIDLSADDLAVFTADFVLLRAADDVVRAARGAVRRMPGVERVAIAWLTVPAERVEGTRWASYYGTGGYVRLAVPVEAALEARVHGLIESEFVLDRVQGVLALRFFRSEENVARATALLKSPDDGIALNARSDDVGLWLIRLRAYETLRYWGIDAEEPAKPSRLE